MTRGFLTPWRTLAACHERSLRFPSLGAAWITESGPHLPEARATCLSCPVRMECLVDALTDRNSYGMRGGYFFNKGALTRTDSDRLVEELGLRSRVRQKTRRDAPEAISS